MKVREIDRLNYLKNSPLKRWVYLGTFLIVGATTAYGGYLIVYRPDKIKSKVDFYFELFNFEKLSDNPNFRTKNTDKRVQANAFKQYLEEKKANKSRLDEDTRRRLERLINKNKEPQEVVPAASELPVAIQQNTEAVKSRRARLVSYTKSWYDWIVGKKTEVATKKPNDTAASAPPTSVSK